MKKKAKNRPKKQRHSRSGFPKLAIRRKTDDLSAPHDSENIRDLLNRAQLYLDRGQSDKALEIAVPMWGKISRKMRTLYLDHCRILAFASAGTGQLDEAVNYARAGLREAFDTLDFYFVLAVVCTMQADYSRVIDHAEKYESLFKQEKADPAARGQWDKTHTLRHQLLNAYGVALLEKGHPDLAEVKLQEALKLNPEYESTYINLDLLYLSLGDEERARAAVEQGRNMRSLKEVDGGSIGDNRGLPSISVCMIVKNEEAMLPRCLKSIRNLADEIILVDTGSEDNTMKIAEEFGCRTYHYPWQGDFSSARNESLRYATKDWIFIIDADEELPSGEDRKIRYFVEKPDIEIISISVYSKSLETDRVSSFLPSVRLFKRRLGLKFEGIVHNHLNIQPGTPVSRCDIKLYHYGYDLSRDKLEKKLARSRALLDRQLQDNPNDILANFNMAQLLRGTKEAYSEETSRQIIEHADRVLMHPEARSEKYSGQFIMAHHQAASAWFNLKEYERCVEYCLKALELKPDYIDPLLSLGNAYCAMNIMDKARGYYYRYLEGRRVYNPEIETRNIIMVYLDYEHMAWYGLGVIAQNENNVRQAIEYFQSALAARDNYLDCYRRLGRLYLDDGNPAEARKMFETDLDQNEPTAEAFFGSGEALSRQGREEEALDKFSRAAEINPDHVHIRFRLGKTLLKLDRKEEGVIHLIQAAEQNHDDISIWMESANLLFNAGSFLKASEYYSKTLEHKPDHGDALNNLANCYFKMDNLREAAEAYLKVIEKYPGYLLAYRNLALTYYKMDEYDKALESIRRYYDRKPDDVGVLKLMGDLYLKLANHRCAIDAYERYLQKYGSDPAAWLNLADAYLQQGYGDAAVLGYQKVLALNPEHAEARIRIKNLSVAAKLA